MSHIPNNVNYVLFFSSQREWLVRHSLGESAACQANAGHLVPPLTRLWTLPDGPWALQRLPGQTTTRCAESGTVHLPSFGRDTKKEKKRGRKEGEVQMSMELMLCYFLFLKWENRIIPVCMIILFKFIISLKIELSLKYMSWKRTNQTNWMVKVFILTFKECCLIRISNYVLSNMQGNNTTLNCCCIWVAQGIQLISFSLVYSWLRVRLGFHL